MKQRFSPNRGSFTRTIKLLLLTLVCFIGLQKSADASHFRYHSTSWSHSPTAPLTVTFQITQSWRWSAFGNPGLGTTVNTGSYQFGDGTSSNLPLLVTSINSTEDWFTGVVTLTHTYGSAGNFTAQFNDCCRIGALLDGNSGGSERIATLVTLSGPFNNSPVTGVPAIVNMQLGVLNTFAIPGFDPDGDALSFSLSTSAESALSTAFPPGLTLSPSGVISYTPPSGGLRAVSVKVTDSKGAYTMVDFIIRASNSTSTPPFFNYSITPANNFVYSVQPGTPINFGIQASDVDAGAQVTLTASGVPSGATFSPNLPVLGTPTLNTNFSWTPTIANLGSYIISFTATDNNSQQTITNVIINVNVNPVFDYPPTPPNGTGFCLMTGVPFSQLVQAQNTLSNLNTEITSVSGLSGTTATTTPALPTGLAPIAQTTLNWTPAPSEWGPHTATFVATDAASNTASTSFNLLVNTSPVFTSPVPSSSAIVGTPYSQALSGTDANTPYGDVLSFHLVGAPAWLTLTDNGNGTGSIQGTPGAGDAGSYTFDIILEDIYHHCGPVVKQTVTINVSACVLSLSTTQTNATCNGVCNGTATVNISGYTPANGTFENGFTGWSTLGNASVEGVYGGINPVEGSNQGLIITGAVDVPSVETFLNLPSGSIASSFGGGLTYGSSMKRTLTVNAGDVVTLNWNFLSLDYLPYNDVSFLSITGNSLVFLADVSTQTTVSNMGSNPGQFIYQSGYNCYSYTFANAGTYELGFGVFNRFDNNLQAGLLVDNISMNQTITWSTSPAQHCATATGLCAGTYTVTVVDGACSATSVVTITEPAAIAPTTQTASACQYYTWTNGTTYYASGSYTHTFVSASGCDSIATLVLTINPLPVVTAPNLSACAGVPVTLGGSPAGGVWSLPNPYLGSSTTYYYYYTNANGCSNSASATVTVGTPIVINMTATNVTGISASINYQAVGGIGWYEFRYKPVASSTWSSLITSSSSFTTKLLTGLTPNTLYEVEARGYCSTTLPAGPWTNLQFQTNGLCDVPTGLFVTNISANTAKLNWNAVPGIPAAGSFYTIRYKKSSATTWTTTTSNLNSKIINSLSASTAYDFQVRSTCGSSNGAWSAMGNFTTAATKGGASITPVEVSANAISVYPNPTQDECNVEFSSDASSIANVKLVDMSGRVVMEQQVPVEEGFNIVTLSLGNLTNGIYAIQVYNNGQLKSTSRVIKN